MVTRDQWRKRRGSKENTIQMHNHNIHHFILHQMISHLLFFWHGHYHPYFTHRILRIGHSEWLIRSLAPPRKKVLECHNGGRFFFLLILSISHNTNFQFAMANFHLLYNFFFPRAWFTPSPFEDFLLFAYFCNSDNNSDAHHHNNNSYYLLSDWNGQTQYKTF